MTDASADLNAPLDSELADQPQDAAPDGSQFKFDWEALKKSPGFVPGVVLVVAMLLAFWPLIGHLPDIWFGEDGYYSHGILVPFISAYVVFRWWPGLSRIPVKPAYLALVPLIGVLWVTRASTVNQVDQATSACLVSAILFGVAFIAGWRWMFRLFLPTLYLAFALPIWNMAITFYTNPLQVLSTKVAFQMLNVIGMQPIRNENFIYLDKFQLDVGVPCSGLKLVLALYAFTFFFAMIAKLRVWANLVLIVVVPLPLALFINGLRIALIGVVGNTYGSDAGHKFHDYSGYITLGICFLILFRIARWLGWKD